MSEEQSTQTEKETVEINEEDLKAEDVGLSEEEALVARFEQLIGVVDSVSHQMSARSLNRVLRSVLRHPLLKPVKFVNNVEKMVFDAAIQATDVKFMFINKTLAKFEQQNNTVNDLRKEVENEQSSETESNT